MLPGRGRVGQHIDRCIRSGSKSIPIYRKCRLASLMEAMMLMETSKVISVKIHCV